MRLKTISLAFMMMSSALAMQAQKPVNAPSGGKQISDELIGIFFEDISSSADGGLYAELVQNGSFEFNLAERDGWGPGTAWRVVRPGHSLGLAQALQQEPLHANNPNYMRLNIERVGHYYDYDGWTGFGLENNGFDGINVKKNAKYDFSLFARCVDGKDKQVRVVLLVPGKERKVLADTTITVSGKAWKKYAATLTASEDCPKAALQVLALNTGVMDVDMLSLMPQDTYKGHGLRRDLAEALEALNPKFMRFPGGCVVHGGGDGFWNTYRWKTTVGPKEQRRQLKNTWGYHQSMGLGYYEYFQLCEDMNMQPVPILPCGVSCQGTNGGWGMKTQAQDVVPMNEMDEWVQDALDLIEWANGDASTKWGRVRAEAGHPKPFNLKYLGIGNEEKITPEFAERFKYMYDKITKAHPEIVIVGTAGPGSHPGNPDFDNGWKIAEEIGLPILDEHYYEKHTYFETSRQYDSYPRDRKTKVYLGEYASKDKKLRDALAEALYLIHVERNGDVVCMTSYAPLFAKKNATNWNPDLIYFDNERPFLTCSYYVQQMFGKSSGNYYYGDCVKFSGEKTNMQEQSVVLNTKTRQLFVKLCNASADSRTATIDLSRFKGVKTAAVKTTISGSPDDENNYDAQPIAPVTENVKVKKQMNVDVKPYSFTMFTINL
ncbi:MAG: alpha-L-arabinofuranosidase C-terminal domain-containing protein [Prevotellaceae bacterium]|nr:alpha-L-arabinofuranosidase C-terminal domain-containing protein [Prevotellaceae bacterium]MDY2749614.1 alpha-L-arabinofuranosidase C-terminal domain-containing protein [Prevotella sp.]